MAHPFRFVLRTLLWSAAAITIAVVAVVIWQRDKLSAIVENRDVIFERAQWAQHGKSAQSLVEYLQAHPDTWSLAVWEVGEEGAAVVHHADRPRPLASTMKILVLAAYAKAVERGELQPDERIPLSDWDALYQPGTDGGAHATALAELESRGAIKDETVALRDIARAMIVQSDNAAPDYLMLRLGEARLKAVLEEFGVPEEEAPFPLSGSQVLVRSPPDGQLPMAWMEALEQKGRAHIAEQSWALARRLAADEEFRRADRERLEQDGIGLNLREQMAYAQKIAPRGTARGYAKVMERVVTAPSSSGWALSMSEALEWPLQRSEKLRAEFRRFGTKGGSLPAVVTSAYFAQPDDQRPRVLALFIEDLPMALWGQLMKTYVQQDLERMLLRDPAHASTLVPTKAAGQ